MKKNLFEMGADWSDDWASDNKPSKKATNTAPTLSPEKHQLHFAKEKRRGKVVTIARPFQLESSDLKSLLKTLKKQLGTGGTIRDDALEFQGNIPTQLRSALTALGYRFKS